MSTTTHLGITLVDQAQSQKEVTVNEALTRIDAILNNGAKSRSMATPPSSPGSGDLYIVGTSPTGAWAGQANQLAYFDQIWQFIVPSEGMTLWVDDVDLIYSYNGSSWITGNSINVQTGTSYSIAASDNGNVVECSNTASITVILPKTLPAKTLFKVVQTGAGQITFSPQTGATLHNRSSFTKTAGQWGVVNFYITTNSDGNSAVYVMSGDGA